jgi:hypothetical protein
MAQTAQEKQAKKLANAQAKAEALALASKPKTFKAQTLLKSFEKKESQLINHGLVRDFFTPDTTFRFIPKNFRDKSKPVVVRFAVPNGTENPTLYFVSCSKPISQLARAGEINLSQLANLPIVQLEDYLNPKTNVKEPSFRISLPQELDQGNDDHLLGDASDDTLESLTGWLPENLLDF